MAEDEDDVGELDKEIAELEKELAALEEGEDPEEIEEPELEPEEDEGGLREKVPFLGGSEEDEEADAEEAEGEAPEEASEPEPEPAEADPEAEDVEEAEEEDEGRLSGFLGRFRGSSEEEEAEPEPEEPIEPEPAEEADAPEPEPEEEPGAALEEEPPEPETPATDEELSEAERRRRGRSAAWERTEEGWRRRDPEEVGEPLEAEEPEEGDEPVEEGPEEEEDEDRAAALLGRFRGSSEADEEEADAEAAAVPPEDGPEEDDEEDEDRSKLVIAGWILLILIAIVLIALLVAWLFGGDGGNLQASVASDALQNDAGAYIATVGSAIRLDASGSQGEIAEYRWAFGDGESTTTQEPTVRHTYTSRGSYNVTLTLVGTGGATKRTTIPIVAVQPPTAEPAVLLGGEPVAAPGEVGNNVFIGQTVTLDGEASTADPAHSLTSFSWDVNGDGQPDATGATAQTSFDQAGRWIVNLTVKDDLGNKDSATRRVHVADQVRFENETVGPAIGGDTTAQHNVTIDAGRGNVTPVQTVAVLTYNASGTGGPLSAQTQSDLDLSVVNPNGENFTAQDDGGSGEETLTLESGDLSALGQWTFRVTHDGDQGVSGSGNSVEYTLVVRVIY